MRMKKKKKKQGGWEGVCKSKNNLRFQNGGQTQRRKKMHRNLFLLLDPEKTPPAVNQTTVTKNC